MGLLDKLRGKFSKSKAVEVEAKPSTGAATPTSVAPEKVNLNFKGDFTFDTNSAAIHKDLNEDLDSLAEVLKEVPQAVIQIEGHTDNTGKADYNQQLSEKRAISVRDALVKRGIDASRMSIRGCGQTMPIADNSTPEGRTKNRRIAIKLDTDLA